jgi:hypothetical protein
LAELRWQFAGLKSLIDALPTMADVESQIESHSSANGNSVATLVQTLTSPPTHAQLEAIQNNLNELIAALKQP